MEHEGALRAVAERQHNVVTRDQARAVGITAAGLVHRTEAGLWASMGVSVLRLVGAEVTPATLAMAAVLDAGAGAALSHSSALAWWRVPGFELAPWHVLRTRAARSRTRHLGLLHTTTYLPDNHVRVCEAIPVTSPARTLVDVAAMLHPARLERVLDTMWAQRLVSFRGVSVMLDALGAKGRPGIRALRAIMAERDWEYVPPESGLESRLMWIMRRDGQPPLDRQVDVGGEFWIGRVDFVDRRLKVIVEVDGDRFHASPLDRARDEQRTKELEAAGWVVVRFGEWDIWHRPDFVASCIRSHRRAQARALGLPFAA